MAWHDIVNSPLEVMLIVQLRVVLIVNGVLTGHFQVMFFTHLAQKS